MDDQQIKETFKEINMDLDKLIDFALDPSLSSKKDREIEEIHKKIVQNLKAVEFSLIKPTRKRPFSSL